MIDLQQFEDFASDAEAVRKAVIAGGFANQRGPDGAIYTGISQYPVLHWYRRIEELIGYSIVPKLSCFRLNLEKELPHSWVHSDVICAAYASVLYLNTPDQCRGGTAFWHHTKSGVNRLLPEEELRELCIDPDIYYRRMEREWKILELWKQDCLIPMKWNRFITYRTSLFHSRYPFEAFGKGPEDGRLIWVCFYDRVERSTI
jgi:hypothetical protein